MSLIATYVFLDLETTGIPNQEHNKTKITEISLVAVKRTHVMECRPGASPRVQHKLTLCLNPGRMIHPECTQVTGLCNDVLEHEPNFSPQVFTLINNFFNILSKPVCLIAQNGMNFDYPILKAQLLKLNVNFDSDLLCADCLHCFYDVLEVKNNGQDVKPPLNNNSTISTHNITCKQETNTTESTTDVEHYSIDYILKSNNALAMQSENDKTPKSKKQVNRIKGISKVRRRFPWGSNSKPKNKYKLSAIYERLLDRTPLDAHRAENDCLMAMECAVAISEDFVNWVDNNTCLFDDVKPMRPGFCIGD